MSESSGSTTCDAPLHLQWKMSGRRSRKSGCPNIFSGVNIQQLHRLLRGAGDKDAEHRARLVRRGTEEETEKEVEEEDREVEERRDKAGLAQALVGLRVRARNKAGFRVEGPKEHKWLKASGYLRIPDPLSSYTVDQVNKEADADQSPVEFVVANDDSERIQNPFKPCLWRLDVVRQTERYLHRILH